LKAALPPTNRVRQEAVVKIGLSSPKTPKLISDKAPLDPRGAEGFLNSGTEEPWVLNPNKSGKVGQRRVKSGFQGEAVGLVHKNLKYWKDTFEANAYVTSILEKGYRILVKMLKAERTTTYRVERGTTRAHATKCLSCGPR
jgi:hypothetical protein